MKTLTIQLSLTTVNKLDDNAQFYPNYIKTVIKKAHEDILYDLVHTPVKDLPPVQSPTVNYAVKVSNDLHLDFKNCAIANQLTLAEFSGRLFELYYNGV